MTNQISHFRDTLVLVQLKLFRTSDTIETPIKVLTKPNNSNHPFWVEVSLINPQPGLDRLTELQTTVQGIEFFVQPQPGGTKKDDIRYCTTVIAEDDSYRPLEDKITDLEESGLPSPSGVVWTGGKSIHSYWCFKELLSVKRQQEITRLIRETLSVVAPLAEYDERFESNHAQMTRLVGGYHPSGQQTAILETNDYRYQESDFGKPSFRYTPSNKSSFTSGKLTWKGLKPCPVCGRTKDLDCRGGFNGADLRIIQCHDGNTFKAPVYIFGESISTCFGDYKYTKNSSNNIGSCKQFVKQEISHA